jgi:hypothetical protein
VTGIASTEWRLAIGGLIVDLNQVRGGGKFSTNIHIGPGIKRPGRGNETHPIYRRRSRKIKANYSTHTPVRAWHIIE